MTQERHGAAHRITATRSQDPTEHFQITQGTKVRHKEAGTIGTVLRGPVKSGSPYAPGDWAHVEVDDDGFRYWTPVESIERS